MRGYAGKLYHAVAMLVICALLAPSIASAERKPLDPGTVHVRIMKRGVNNWIALQENNGVQLFGRIIAINDQSFTLQLHNDPQTTEILYTDVVDLRTGGFTKGQTIFMIAGIGAVAGLGIWGFIHVHNLQNKPLEPPIPALR
jgi:hypothetical protein